jgi:hypothetical protein
MMVAKFSFGRSLMNFLVTSLSISLVKPKAISSSTIATNHEYISLFNSLSIVVNKSTLLIKLYFCSLMSVMRSWS